MDVALKFHRPTKAKRLTRQIPRTRTGCWSCRDKSVKCDEQRPQCDRCKRLGRSCNYGLKLQWEEDSISRGISHGRERQRQRASIASNCPDYRPSSALKVSRSQEQNENHNIGNKPQIIRFFINTSCDDIDHYLRTITLQLSKDRGGKVLDLDQIMTERENSEYVPRVPCVAQSTPDQTQSFVPKIKGNLPDFLTSSVPTPLSTWPSLNASDYYIMEYYDRVICSTTSLFDAEPHSSQKFVIIPLSCLSDSIRTAVLALSARKLAYREPRFHMKALSYRNQVLKTLAEDLPEIQTNPIKFLECLASTLILCWCDITDMCKPTWTKHVIGMSTILHSRPKSLSHDHNTLKLMRTCRQYVIFHLIMLKATFSSRDIVPNLESILRKNIASWEIWDDIESHSSLDTPASSRSSSKDNDSGFETDDMDLEDILSSYSMQQIDTNQGFSNGLLLLINYICDLKSDSSDSKQGNESEISSKMKKIEHSLQTLKQIPPDMKCTNFEDMPLDAEVRFHKDDIMQRRLESIVATAEANRLGALLFLETQTAARSPLASDRIKDIINLAEEVCEKDVVTASLPIWPIFLAGCFCSEEYRLRVLGILHKFQRERTFGGLPPACAVIESFWRQRDLSSDENPRNPHPGSTPDSFTWSSEISEKKQRQLSSLPLCLSSKRGYPWEKAMFVLKGSILSLT